MSPGAPRGLRIQAVITGMACGGAERQMAMLTSGLADRGHDVRLAVLHGRDSFFELDPRVEVRYFERECHISSRFWRHLARYSWLRRVVENDALDAVISFIDVANVHALWAARRCGAPVIVAEHTHPPLHHVRWLERWMRQLLYPRAASIVALTTETAEWLRGRRLGTRVEVIPNPVVGPADARTSRRDGDKPNLPTGPIVVAMGRFVRSKRFDLVIDAFAEVAPRHPGWNLVIVGDGPERRSLEARVSKLGLGDRVTLTGIVADPAVVFEKSEVFVLASDYEGFPTALCEAMAHGLAVIATDCPVGPREIVRDGVDGVLVPPGHRASLVVAFEQLMEDKATRELLGEAAAAVTDRFALSAILDRWESLLTCIVQGGPA